MIADELQEFLAATCPPQRITDVVVGQRYTAVRLEDGNVGLAYTLRDKPEADPPELPERSLPVGKSTAEVLPYLSSDEGLERSLGLAVANALANRRGAGQQEGDVLSVLAVGFLDRVGMVGYFGPLIAPLTKRTRKLLIFERDAGHPEQVLPAEQAFEELPGCTVAIITATALVFGELDRLLEAAAGCREIAIVGPSTPLVPEAFGPFGVTLLSGVTAVDGAGLLEAVRDGGGTAAFIRHVRKVNVRPWPSS